MGLRGPAASSSSQRALRGQRSGKPSTSAPDAPLTEMPPPLLDLSAEAAAFWTETGEMLVAKGGLVESDLPMFADLARAEGMFRSLMKAVGKKVTAKGSTGQTITNPLLQEARQWAGHVARLSERFGLTPGARQRVAPPPPPAAKADALDQFLTTAAAAEAEDPEEDSAN